MRRTIDVARIQLFNAPAVHGIPVLVLAATFLINYVLFASIGSGNTPDENITGALMSLYFVLLIAHVQTVTQIFPFTLGLSVTRRTFFAATSLVIAGQALVYGVLLYVLRVLEQATGGWGMELTFFALPFLTRENPLLQVVVYAVPFLFMSFLGVWLGIVFKRWGVMGVYTLAIGGSLLLVAIPAVVSWRGWWPEVGRFFVAQPEWALLTGYPLGLAALLAGASYLTMRRAIP